MLNADSGRVADPDDPTFVLTFKFDGVRIKAQDIFTAFLDGFVIAAAFNNKNHNAKIPVARQPGQKSRFEGLNFGLEYKGKEMGGGGC